MFACNAADIYTLCRANITYLSEFEANDRVIDESLAKGLALVSVFERFLPTHASEPIGLKNKFGTNNTHMISLVRIQRIECVCTFKHKCVCEGI